MTFDADGRFVRDPEKSLKEQLYEYISRINGVSFAELVPKFPEHNKGDHVLCVNEYQNIIMWRGMSEEYVVAFIELLNEDKIVASPTQLLVYAADGIILNIPIARRAVNYKTLRWLPVSLSTPEHIAAWKKRGGKV